MSQPTRYPPDDPREWLNRARSNLAAARLTKDSEDVYPEDVCFEAQQTVEKAIKAVLLWKQLDVPKVHDIAHLLTLMAGCGIDIPARIAPAAGLTDYAVVARYPDHGPGLSNEDSEAAIDCAEAVLRWAEQMIEPRDEEPEAEGVDEGSQE
ncbi:MAG: HEPN domain-containing protein [Planctomycetota bacterium]